MLSNTAEYALRAALLLARRQGEGPVRVGDIAAELGVPRNYLSKVLHVLVKRGYLRSLRGPRGGFEMAVPAASLSLRDVVAPFDDIEARRTCLLGRRECSEARPCAVHDRWSGAAAGVTSFFRDTRVGDLVGDREEGPVGREAAEEGSQEGGAR